MLHKSLPTDVVRAIDEASSAMLEDVLSMLGRKEVSDISGCHAIIDQATIGEDYGLGLETDEQLDLLDCHGEELGFSILEHRSISDLRQRIGQAAAAVASSLARQLAAEAIAELENVLDENDLDFAQLSTSNAYAWARHYEESSEGPDVQVYCYRNVEGTHVDVLEVEIWPEIRIYLYRRVDAADLTAEELSFDAT